MAAEDLVKRFYSDARYDGTAVFYSWVRDYVRRDMVMLNLGAGPEVGRSLRSFRGEAARVVGADIDPAVLNNPGLDEAHVCSVLLPFTDRSFEVVISDYVLEHIEKPAVFMAEVHRVLKDGGSFFFRTPNQFHYVSIAARLTPHSIHRYMANRLRMLNKDAHEPYPTYFRLNTGSAIRSFAYRAGFSQLELRFVETEPSYLKFSRIAFLAGVAYERLVNRFEVLAPLRANIFGRLVK